MSSGSVSRPIQSRLRSDGARGKAVKTGRSGEAGQRNPTVISLFSGALGLDLGLENAGFKLRVAVECNKYAVETIKANRPGLPVIEKKLEDVSTEEILREAGLAVGDATLLSGGPSCQSFSTAGQRASLADPRGVLFRQFLRVVREARPRFFLMENVRGVLSAAITHRPLSLRGPGHPPLRPEEELGSAFKVMLRELAETNYYIVFGLTNAADFGVPQVRHRLLVLGSRDGEFLDLPRPTHNQRRWVTLEQALEALEDPQPAFEALSASKTKLLKLVPAGGNWRSLPKKRQAAAIGGAYKSWGGRSGFLRRLSWDKPSPSVTTAPSSTATMLCHPDELRPLSLRECARLQQFPQDWHFCGPLSQQYAQVGNAVPVGLGSAVGRYLMRIVRGPRVVRSDLLGKVACLDPVLLKRLREGPRTILNPSRMRADPTLSAAKKWIGELGGHRLGEEVVLQPKIAARVGQASTVVVRYQRLTASGRRRA